METTLHTKPRISRQDWRESPPYDWGEIRLAIDPTAWQGWARQIAFARARSASPIGVWLGALTVDAGALVPSPSSLVARPLVLVDADAMVESGQWDWEDTDSFDRRTIERVRDLLESLTSIARNTFGYSPEIPHPAPADGGSIDVFFEGAERNLLINTPRGDERVTYFGSDRSGTTCGGSLSRTNSDRDLMTLAAWIMEIR